jgi:hypothetical protein
VYANTLYPHPSALGFPTVRLPANFLCGMLLHARSSASFPRCLHNRLSLPGNLAGLAASS